MRFYFPDSQDQIDPRFDFVSEEHPALRRRQRDDRYAHEVLDEPPYDGILISKASVDGIGGAGRYNAGQRRRLHREGIRAFMRLDSAPGPMIDTIGDCGAFTYVEKISPPYTVDEVIDFYELTRVDAGLSVDHVVSSFSADGAGATDDDRRRHRLTLGLAERFIGRHEARGCDFEPVGVTQGYDPESYATAAARLEATGYGRIALGGLVRSKSEQIEMVLEAVAGQLSPATRVHLLGITRFDELDLENYGVESVDSTTPFRQAWIDGEDNFHTGDGSFTAIRVPQLQGNRQLRALVAAGRVAQDHARLLEAEALGLLRRFDDGEVEVEEVLDAVCAYQALLDPRDRRDAYRRTLEAAPWRSCGCELCIEAGIEIALFRGAERNKRRGFHNLAVLARRRKALRPSGTRAGKGAKATSVSALP